VSSHGAGDVTKVFVRQGPSVLLVESRRGFPQWRWATRTAEGVYVRFRNDVFDFTFDTARDCKVSYQNQSSPWTDVNTPIWNRQRWEMYGTLREAIARTNLYL